MLKVIKIIFIFILSLLIPVIEQETKVCLNAIAAETIGDNYYDEEKSTKWDNPKLINVYIEDNSDKSYLVKQAFYIWNNELDLLFDFNFVNSEENANIVCKFTHKLGEAAAAHTHYNWLLVMDRNGNKKRIFDTNKQVEITIAYSNDAAGYFENTPEYFLTVILHEIGHALGITGYHSDNQNDIMYPDSTKIINKGKLSQRDINTIKMIYSKIQK